MAGSPRVPGAIGRDILPPKKKTSPGRVVADPRKGGIHDIVSSVPPPSRPLDVRGIQAHLKAQGYDLRVDNKIGPKTLSALADYLQVSGRNPLAANMAKLLKGTPITGRRDPKAWNTRFGSPATRPVVSTTTVDQQGNTVTPSADPGVADDPTAPASLDLSSLFAGVSAPASRVLPEAWANSGAKLLDPNVAETLAGIQFDPAIRDTGIQQDRMGRTNEQNLTDVKNWFGQVLGSQATAAKRDSAITEAGVGSIRDSGAAILSAIGGEAAEGAGMVGSANAQAVGTLEALGANQDQYNADLRPLLEAEKAGAQSRESAMGTARAQDLANRLTSLQGERGAAKAGFQFEVDQANNGIRDNRAQRALEIRQANNGIAQQNFQNALALAQAQMGAAMTGIKIEQGIAELNGGGDRPATSYPWAKAPVSQKNAVYNQALSTIFNGEGLTTSVPRAVQLVNQILAGNGWSRKNPAVMALRNQILQDAGIRPDARWR